MKGVLLDIEGTTTPIDFVYKRLFPYAGARIKSYLAGHLLDEDVRSIILELYEEHAKDTRAGLNPPLLAGASSEPRVEAVADYALWLMDLDRKSTPLKALQGRIWEEGYASGELVSQVFADVPAALARWSEAGKDLRIYSSGSELAQRLLFSNTEAGDLTRYIRGYFDTKTGPKREAETYRRISEAFQLSPRDILFISDVVAELDAARGAGFETMLAIRPGNHPQPEESGHITITSFDQL
jgi:enolase-phosphatase E1